jgi:hypothetical protein
MRRRWMISVPTDSAATSRARCKGSASSGAAASRPYMRPSQSSDFGSRGEIARRRRSRKASASSRRVRHAGDREGSSRNESAAAAEILATQARELEEAGCFSLVLECVPSEAAWKVTDLLKIPTIGIGAGPNVGGQVLVYQDVLGLNPGFKPKFLRTYANTFGMILAALNAYDRDVKDGHFPSESESYELHPANLHIAKHAA